MHYGSTRRNQIIKRESCMMRKYTPIKMLRVLTGMFDPEQAVNILSFVNLIARYLDNDPNLQEEFLKDQFKLIGVELILDEEE